jgi:hypothetical protein
MHACLLRATRPSRRGHDLVFGCPLIGHSCALRPAHKRFGYHQQGSFGWSSSTEKGKKKIKRAVVFPRVPCLTVSVAKEFLCTCLLCPLGLHACRLELRQTFGVPPRAKMRGSSKGRPQEKETNQEEVQAVMLSIRSSWATSVVCRGLMLQ